MALIDKVRVIKLLLFALFMMVSMVTPAQSQVDWSIKAGIGMANIIGDNMGSPKVKLAYKLGIGLECPFDKIWSLQTGVSFVSKGTNHTIVETDECFFNPKAVEIIPTAEDKILIKNLLSFFLFCLLLSNHFQ